MARAKKQVEDTSFKEFLLALDEIEKSKGIDKEEIIEAVEAAIISAYKTENNGEINVKVIIDRESGVLKVYSQKEVVEEVTVP
ncbi:MAG: transcription termination/antitermination protein NusA, partial [Anaerofustis stercorihominis]|nr:transcription termination/antitermination protein NusA [Anaerofustis stercorihominis]